jgi:uncharacterized protein involved in exopolysaccharide biosynthesis
LRFRINTPDFYSQNLNNSFDRENHTMSNQIVPPLVSASAIWRGKWFIAVSMTAALAAAFGYLQVAAPVYEAEARLLLRQKGFQFDAENGFLKDRQFLATEAEILRSEPVLTRALQRVTPRLPDGYTKDALTLVLESLTVTPSPVADVLRVNYTSHVEQDAVEVIRAAIDSYQEILYETEGNVYGSTVNVLSDREQQLREQIAVLQQQYEELRESSPLVGQGREAMSLHARQLTTLGDRLATARGRKFEVEKKLESFVSFKDDLRTNPEAMKLVLLRELDGSTKKSEPPEPTEMHNIVSLSYTGFGDAALQNSAAAQMFRQQAESKLAQMHDVERQYWLAKAAEIRTTQKSTHPNHTKVDEEMRHWEELVKEHHEGWDRFLTEQVEALSNVLEQELKTAKRTEQELESQYAEIQERAKKTDSYLLREQLVQRKIDRLETVHETMLVRLVDFELADQGVAKGRASVDVRVLEGPELTSRQVWPLPPFILAGSLLFGCMVPVALLATFGRKP